MIGKVDCSNNSFSFKNSSNIAFVVVVVAVDAVIVGTDSSSDVAVVDADCNDDTRIFVFRCEDDGGTNASMPVGKTNATNVTNTFIIIVYYLFTFSLSLSPPTPHSLIFTACAQSDQEMMYFYDVIRRPLSTLRNFADKHIDDAS